jgi:D-alanine-D-alanine ligase
MVVQAMSKEDVSDDSVEPPGSGQPDQVLLIYSQVDGLDRGTEDDLLTDLETVDIAQRITDSLVSTGNAVTPVPVRSVRDAIMAAQNFDPVSTLIFNLCESLRGMIDGESAVLRPLEEMGFAYLGGTPANLDACRDKISTKRCLSARHVATAPYQIFRTGKESISVPLPAIVKPAWEDSSVGITREAVVHDEAALRRRVAYIIEMYRQPALVEMFLDGREFNISVWGNDPPQVLPLAETNFAGWDEAARRVLNFESKWSKDAEEYYTFTVDCPARVDARTARAIRKLSLDAWRAMDCRDYIRVDIREKDNILYVLDVNPNPGMATDAGFPNAARVAGYEYPQMIQRLVNIGWRRALGERMLMTA